jgi:hypothetical protein
VCRRYHKTDRSTRRTMKPHVLFSAVTVIAFTKIVSIVLYSDSPLRQSPSVFSTHEYSPCGSSANHVLSPPQQHGHWIGSTWIPPSPSWRLYDPVEMLHAYSGKSVLFIGDSTSRRLAQTLYMMLEETESGLKSNPLTLSRYQQGSNVTPVSHVNQHVPHTKLNDEQKLAENKRVTTSICPFLEELAVFEHNGTINSRNDSLEGKALNINDFENQFPYLDGICHRMPGFPSIQGNDHDNHSQATPMLVSLARCCPFQVEHWIRSNIDQEYNQLSRFDVVVIGTGVWEAVQPHLCRSWSNLLYPGDPVQAQRNHMQIAEGTMMAIAEYITTQYTRQKQRREGGLSDSTSKYPKIPMIVWRTAGYDQNRNHELIDSMNQRIIDLYEEIVSERRVGNSSSPFRMEDYFRLVDWGGAVRPRSFRRYVKP